MKGDRILITGGYGNLGSWLVRFFQSQQYDVTILASPSREGKIDNDGNTIFCDISDETSCKQQLAGLYFDFVIHAASSNDFFIEDYARTSLLANALGTRNILHAIETRDLKNFIYLSTFHVYGQIEGVVNEDTIPNPKNDYALTHLFGEFYVKQYHQNRDIPYTVIRLTNSYGCPLDLHTSKWYLVLNDLSKMAFNHQKIRLQTNGLAKRDFIHMGDVAIILEKICQLKNAPNDVYNLSGERTYSIYEIATVVQSAYERYSGLSIPIEVNNEDTSLGHALSVSTEKLKTIIDYDIHDRLEEESKNIFLLLSENQ